MQKTISSFKELKEKLEANEAKVDIGFVEEAYTFAAKIHKGQKTPQGRKRIEHLLNTANIISETILDEETLAAALLHESLFWGNVNKRDVERLFGKEVTKLVEQHKNEKRVEETNLESVDWELLSQIVLASAKDIRSIFIRIATSIDSLGGSEFLQSSEMKKRALIALNVYAPICHKLGLMHYEMQLEDLAFKILYREEYNQIKELVDEKIAQREKKVVAIRSEIERLMKKDGLDVFIQARAKHFYSIFKKLGRTQFGEIYDLLGTRVICDSEADCYKALGVINSKYSSLAHKFRDYIAEPKKNNYKSIHTVVLFGKQPVELQIRTWKMHWDNEVGLAAHWQYKEFKKDKYFDSKLSIIKQLMEWHQTSKGANLLKQSLKTSSGEERVFVFTPKGKVVILREDSTPIDFAFAIHSDIGVKAKGAKVNGKVVPLNQPLENSDTVEILTTPNKQVKRQWLSFVKTEKAKAKIRQALGLSDANRKKKIVTEKPDKTTSDISIRMANCCKPLPGDEIMGYRTTKRKISVHRKGCPSVENIEKNREINIEWSGTREKYKAELSVKANENSALFPQILRVFSENKVRLTATNAKTNKNKVVSCIFSVSIKNKGQLDKCVNQIAAFPYVLEVSRK